MSRSARGFTIIEIIMTLVILGVLAGLAAPRMIALIDTFRVRSALDQLTSDVYRTRALAARGAVRLKIRFRPTRGCADAYIIETATDGIRIDSVPLRGGTIGVCISSNVSQSMTIDSRGMLIGSPRMLHGRSGGHVDSISVSIVGRVYRWY